MPRVFEIFFDYCEETANPEIAKIAEKLNQIETFKLVPMLYTLFSRFKQQSSKKYVAKIIAKIACEYPS